LWMPLRFLPHVLQTIAPIFPTYHLAQLMYASLGAPSVGTAATHWLSLVGFTLIMLGVSWMAYRRLEQNS
jgi:ABC-2 type transport system permease protein